MNRFDYLSENLTLMMMELDTLPDQGRIKRLMAALTRAHEEACEISRVAREADAMQRSVRNLAA